MRQASDISIGAPQGAPDAFPLQPRSCRMRQGFRVPREVPEEPETDAAVYVVANSILAMHCCAIRTNDHRLQAPVLVNCSG
jgi:hypothetical protein